jgi:hypothetical protein
MVVVTLTFRVHTDHFVPGVQGASQETLQRNTNITFKIQTFPSFDAFLGYSRRLALWSSKCCLFRTLQATNTYSSFKDHSKTCWFLCSLATDFASSLSSSLLLLSCSSRTYFFRFLFLPALFISTCVGSDYAASSFFFYRRASLFVLLLEMNTIWRLGRLFR